MSVDLAVATPAFLDLTFVGLEQIPAPGEERFAGDLLRSPGGGAITAIGAARLGLQLGAGRAARRGRLGRPGERRAEARGRAGPLAPRRAHGDDRRAAGRRRALVHHLRPRRAGERRRARRARASGGGGEPRPARGRPGRPAVYVTCGDDDARAYAGRPPDVECGARALFVNEKEALVLTGCPTPREAAERLSAAPRSWWSRSARAGCSRSARARRPRSPATTSARRSTPPVPETCSAPRCVADLAGTDPETSLPWAGLYAALSVTAATGAAGAVTKERLLEEGARRGLPGLDPAPSPGEIAPEEVVAGQARGRAQPRARRRSRARRRPGPRAAPAARAPAGRRPRRAAPPRSARGSRRGARGRRRRSARRDRAR